MLPSGQVLQSPQGMEATQNLALGVSQGLLEEKVCKWAWGTLWA